MEQDSTSSKIVGQISALRRYALTLARNREDADDLVQDALVRAYEQRQTLKSQASLRGWLMSILHNTFITEWRRRQNGLRQAASLDDVPEASVAAPQESTVRLKQIQQAFENLSADQRDVIHLVAVEGMGYQEAADALGIPIGTLMSRLGRARSALREFEDASSQSGRSSKLAQRSHLKVVGGSDGTP